MIRIFLIGTGRMGTMVRQLAGEDPEFTIVGAVNDTNVGDLAGLDKPVDVVIDFSGRDSLPEVADYIRRTGAALVSGTTGFTDSQMEQLRRLGEFAPVLHSANYSIGVAVLKRLAAEAAVLLGDDFDIEIIETHHNQKADAPSGTAKLLRAAVDPAGSLAPVYGREGLCGKRTKREIGIHAVRGGTVAGEHTVAFFGPDEEIKLNHRADSRKIFAAGALRAAKLLAEKEKGFYTLEDVLFHAARG